MSWDGCRGFIIYNTEFSNGMRNIPGKNIISFDLTVITSIVIL